MSHAEQICFTQKNVRLAQNLPGSKLVDLSQYAYALNIDRQAKFQSRNNAHQFSYEPILIHLCFCSKYVIRDIYYELEIDFSHWIPIARASRWNRTYDMPRCIRSSYMSDFSTHISWIMLNIVVCKQKSISRTVLEEWELEKCCDRSVIQCRLSPNITTRRMNMSSTNI